MLSKIPLARARVRSTELRKGPWPCRPQKANFILSPEPPYPYQAWVGVTLSGPVETVT